MNPQRRAFLQRALAGVSATAAFGLAGCARPPCELPEDADADWADKTFEARAAAVVDAYFGDQLLSAVYIGELLVEADLAGFGDDDLDEFQCAHVEGARSLSEALASIDQARDDDFASHAVVTLHGWVLSPTELQLCALSLRY